MKLTFLKALAALLLVMFLIPLSGCYDESYNPGYGYGGYGYGSPTYAYRPYYGGYYGHPWYAHHDWDDWGHHWGDRDDWHHSSHEGRSFSGWHVGGVERGGGGHSFAHEGHGRGHHRG